MTSDHGANAPLITKGPHVLKYIAHSPECFPSGINVAFVFLPTSFFGFNHDRRASGLFLATPAYVSVPVCFAWNFYSLD